MGDVKILGNRVVIPISPPSGDAGENLKVNTYIWNSGTLAWEASTGGGGEVSGAVEITNFPASQNVLGPLTDDELRATPVDVAGPLTDSELRAVPVPVSGTLGINNFPATQPVSVAALPLPSGAATSLNQAALESLIVTLQELVSRLGVLASWNNGGAAGMRVVGVSMPSTAVTGPLTNAQYIATRAVGAIHYTQRTAIENQAAVLSNINNAVGG